MKNNNVEALTKERKGCNGMHLIICDRQTKLGEPDLFLTADSLRRSEYDALSVVCASYMRLNDDLNRLIKTYREQLEGERWGLSFLFISLYNKRAGRNDKCIKEAVTVYNK